jgi:hypothetical protein
VIGGTECCSSSFCVNGQCCPTVVCGELGSSSRVCPTDAEVCCFVAPDNHGYACPKGDGVGDCAPDGQCCPVGFVWREECDACCHDLFLICGAAPMTSIPPTPGRF